MGVASVHTIMQRMWMWNVDDDDDKVEDDEGGCKICLEKKVNNPLLLVYKYAYHLMQSSRCVT